MTTTLKAFPLALILALMVLILIVPQTGRVMQAVGALENIRQQTHADIRHGGEAQLVRDCLNNVGPTMTLHNPITHRSAEICKIDFNLWGVYIQEENGDEVTSFVKNKMTRLDQVLQYLSNRGYLP